MPYISSGDTRRSLKISYRYERPDAVGITSTSSKTYPGLNVYTGTAGGTSAIDGAFFGDVITLFAGLMTDASTAQVTNYSLVEETTWEQD